MLLACLLLMSLPPYVVAPVVFPLGAEPPDVVAPVVALLGAEPPDSLTSTLLLPCYFHFGHSVPVYCVSFAFSYPLLPAQHSQYA